MLSPKGQSKSTDEKVFKNREKKVFKRIWMELK